MTPITPESLQAAGFEQTHNNRCVMSLNIVNSLAVTVCRDGSTLVVIYDVRGRVVIDRNFTSIEQLQDLIRVLKGQP